jgi:hypothetical protein
VVVRAEVEFVVGETLRLTKSLIEKKLLPGTVSESHIGRRN